MTSEITYSAHYVASLPPEKREQWLQSLSEDKAKFLRYDWRFWARPKQLPPEGDWFCWHIRSGRGWGKTITGAQWIVERAKAGYRRLALIGQTKADVRDTMIEVEESSILNVSPPWFKPDYQPSKRRLVWPNGAIATIFSGDEPGQLRGPQHDCFVAGTIITTINGLAPIESMCIGDWVITRGGACRVNNIGNKVDIVGQVKFANGVELVGTSQHPVLGLHGWTTLADLAIGDKVCTGKKPLMDTLQPIKMARNCTSIGGYGNRAMGQFQRVWKSIIGIWTSKITISTIWNWFQPAAIKSFILRTLNGSTALVQTVARAWLGSRLILARQYAANVNGRGLSKSEKPSEFADTVNRRSCLGGATSVVNVVSTWAPAGIARVYDLTVDGQHEYLANDIYVHNSAWVDELSKFKYPKQTWDMLELGLRIGDNPQVVVTNTPRPIPIIKELMADPRTVDVVGSTYDNIANLAPQFIARVRQKYEGTHLGRQELHGEVLEDREGALWTRAAMIDAHRVIRHPRLTRIVVAVDPPGGRTECGIVVAGLGEDGEGYILEDSSLAGSPAAWGEAVVTAYHRNAADRVVAEVNFGGDMVEHIVRTVDESVAYKDVRASRGKAVRAEPVAALYEQGRVHHVGQFALLEDELCTWVPNEGMPSPNRLDALVWVLTELMLGASPGSWDDVEELGEIEDYQSRWA